MSERSMPAPSLVSPAKALRVLTALRRTLDELNEAAVDDATRRRLVELHRATLIELASAVSDGLIDELVILGMAPLDRDASAAQIKVAEAQLLGWVDGLLRSAAENGEDEAGGDPDAAGVPDAGHDPTGGEDSGPPAAGGGPAGGAAVGHGSARRHRLGRPPPGAIGRAWFNTR